MAKIVLVNAYETSNLGTRILAKYARLNGHSTHNVLLCSGEYVSIDSPLDENEGYQIFEFGKIYTNRATIYKVSDKDKELLKIVLEEEQPDVIGFSARSTNNWLIKELMPVFQSLELENRPFLIAGGYGPTLEPELYLDGGFDFVVRGDGEEALIDILNACDALNASAPRGLAHERERERV